LTRDVDGIPDYRWLLHDQPQVEIFSEFVILNAMRRILVTGGAGYVGSIVVDELLGRGYSVRAFDALFHGSVASLLLPWGNSRFEFLRGDVRDPDARAHAVEGVEAIVHLAAIVGDPACARDPELARAVNFDSTKALVGDAERAGGERFIMASTCSNYGLLNGDTLADETAELNPVSVYAETKVAAEAEVLGRQNGLATTCLRFATVYGTSPRMRFDLTVNEFTRDLAIRNELVVFGEQFWRPYVHVRDAARAIVDVLDGPKEASAGEVYNVGDTRENYQKLHIVDLLRERFPAGDVQFVHRDEDPRNYRVSFKKFEESFGFKAERSVADGIDEVLRLLRSGLVGDPYAPSYSN
jgi:nucleoside-diphosphate-sugar epimerase